MTDRTVDNRDLHEVIRYLEARNEALERALRAAGRCAA